jgi:transcriptional regulator with XRE-family HTH domain
MGDNSFEQKPKPGDQIKLESWGKKMSAMERSEYQGRRRIIDFDIAIGRRLRIQRTLRNVTQTQLADAIGITFQQIQKYEHGTNRISAGKLLQISHFLGVPIGVFFEGLEDTKSGKAHEAAGSEYQQLRSLVASAEGERLYRAFSQIRKKETQLSLVRMVESLADAEDAV